MHCYNIKKLIEDYLENSLSHEQSLQLEAHIQDCPDCSKYMKEMQVLQDLIKGLEEEELPLGFNARLQARLLEVREDEAVQNQQKNSKQILVPKKSLVKWIAGIAAIFTLMLFIEFIQPFGNSSPSRYDDNNSLYGGSADQRMESKYEGELSIPQENPDADANGGETEPWVSYGEGYGEDALDTDISVTVHLYISNDWDLEVKVEEIVAAAEAAQLPVVEKQPEKVVLQIPDDGKDQVTAIIAKLSDMGRISTDNITEDIKTLTIYIEIAD